MQDNNNFFGAELTTRQLIIGGVVLVALVAGGILLVLGITRVAQRNAGADAVPTFPAEVNTPQNVEPQNAAPQASPVIAPTIEPTPIRLQHVVQTGESPSNIALLYNVDLQALLDENNLTQGSFIQAGQVLTVPLPPGSEPVVHTVSFGETLATISAQYNVTLAALQAANNLSNVDNVIEGQQLKIPGLYQSEQEVAEEEAELPPNTGGGEAAPEDLTTIRPSLVDVEGPQQSEWPRSILSGDLAQNYPLTREEARFTIHYQPDTYTSDNIDQAAALLNKSLNTVEERLGVTLGGGFDVYMAGTLYESPSAHLRGLSRSADRRLFILYDGSGDAAENEYLVTHELTHLVAWNTFGAPTSTMLSEGLATYAGQTVLEEAGYTAYDQLCLAAYQSGELPSMAEIETDWQRFQGHIRDYFNYFGSGCFVGWLVEQEGIETVGRLYNTSDYVNLYGESLPALDAQWRDSLEADLGTLTLDTPTLTRFKAELAQAYAYVFGNYNDSDQMHQAYTAVDQARLALWRGDFEQAAFWLDEVYAMTGFNPGPTFAR